MEEIITIMNTIITTTTTTTGTKDLEEILTKEIEVNTIVIESTITPFNNNNLETDQKIDFTTMLLLTAINKAIIQVCNMAKVYMIDEMDREK